jgi:hypothetical protein
MEIKQSVFVENDSIGGEGGTGGVGVNTFDFNAGATAGGPGGSGGAGQGSACFSDGSADLANCTITANASIGGAGGHGGQGGSGWAPAGMPGGIGARGGAGGSGGSGFAAVYGLTNTSVMANCTIALNLGSAGLGGPGGAGGEGGPPNYDQGLPGPPGTNGIGVGGVACVGGGLVNTLLATNMPGNCAGPLTDLGHNMSSDSSCSFTNTGSLNDTDPMLGQLADNGGPTLTMALLLGSPAIDAGNTSAAPATDQRGLPRPRGQAADIGAYEFQSVLHYVDVNNPTPNPPYITWATAATNIQAAMDAAVAGEQVIVSNGVYATGGRAVGTNLLLNRVVVDKPLTVMSLNGPEVTIIEGYQLSGTKNGDGAVRCVYLTNGALLSGFTLTNGATRDWSAGCPCDQIGGGVWCDSAMTVVSNCVLAGNSAWQSGGGAFGGVLSHCSLIENDAGFGGGACQSALNDCTLIGNRAARGGGAANCILNKCSLVDNWAYDGGGTWESTLRNCKLVQNRAVIDYGSWTEGFGGGACWSVLQNCTLVHNEALWDDSRPSQPPYGGEGPGAYLSTVGYCIFHGDGFTECTASSFWYGDPRFVDYASGDLRLQSNSPCINAGNNSYVTSSTDLDGLPRIVGGTVDIGACEFQSPASSISYAWLQSYGLATDGSADAMDDDCDGLNTWQEWRCLTCPTNALSVLQLLSAMPDDDGITVTWQSQLGVSYFLERSTNLVSPVFTPLATDIPGQPDMTVYTDTHAPAVPVLFYRVGVGD